MMMKKMVRLAALAVMTLAVSACEVDVYDPYYDGGFDTQQYLTDRLCNAVWMDSYVSDAGYDCEQELVFYYDGVGKDRTYVWSNPAAPDVHEYAFSWRWVAYNAIEMRYGGNDRSLLEQVQFGSNFLRGYLDGTYVEFENVR